MQISAHAKINWSLLVTGKRSDGYHDIETLFQTISLHDTLTIESSPRVEVTCSDPSIPCDDTNLVVRAARAIGAAARIHIEKRIPTGGGLGGGSSDAAAVLLAFDCRDPQIALSLGSDVPFFLRGGTAYATGRGEKLVTMPLVAPVPLILMFPEERVLTAQAYAMLRRFSPPLGAARYRAMIDDDLLDHATELVNDFEEAVFARLPHLHALKTRLYELGAAWALMSGSGSTIAGAFRSQADRDAALTRISGVRAVACETV
ncbi:MAG TPA: 4-(cytidine 5'-diphospho)-2-C-methyl-D-erythritol kinase [Thermoanaerobaculia bacterium]|nr:4-(cytidine 5'-diphospho)-2-C-methyl-D-erythritol kinase [Thermoanaerobaculia bacterium]